MHIKPENFTTFRFSNGQEVWSYDHETELFDVTHAPDGRLVYRRNQCDWGDEPHRVHQEVVRHFWLQEKRKRSDVVEVPLCLTD